MSTTTTYKIPESGNEDYPDIDILRKTFFNQYIDQYLPTICNTLSSLKANHSSLSIPFSLFLFTVLDYFSFLFIIATNGSGNKKDSSNLISFLTSKYFPELDNCKANFLQFIRNGVAHQIFPKAAGLGYSQSKQLFFEENITNQVIPVLNLYFFEIISMKGIIAFIDEMQQNDAYIHNLYFPLLVGDQCYLGDFAELDAYLNKYCEGKINNIYQ